MVMVYLHSLKETSPILDLIHGEGMECVESGRQGSVKKNSVAGVFASSPPLLFAAVLQSPPLGCGREEVGANAEVLA